MTKILFLIHDLGNGGAEKVLVNLVNNMDRSKFDISVTVLFGGGINEQYLKPDVHFRTVFPRNIPGNSHWMKLLTPGQLHRLCVKEHYDIEVSYLEGPSARIVSGCPHDDTKLVSWIHVQLTDMKKLASSFRSETEARSCYDRFHQTVCVSEFVKQDFCRILDFGYAVQGTVTGILMVFAVLTLLCLILYASKLVFYDLPNKKNEKAAAEKATQCAEETSAEATSLAPVAMQDDGELIAVITAAVAAMIESGEYKNEFAGGFRVVSFKRSEKTAWNRK